MVISKELKLTKVKNATAAGTSDIDSDSVDMTDFETVMFFTTFGTITSGAATSIRIGQSADDVTFNDLLGSSVTVADDDDNQIFYSEIYRPLDQHVRMTVKRATQNAVIGEMYALQGGAKSLPVTNTVTDKATGELHLTPAEGTA